MEQYPVPKFIEEEGRIVFFLTFRQFFLLVGGSAVCFVLFFTVPFLIFIPLAFIIAMIILSIAFLKINNEPAFNLFLHFISFSTKKRNYTWKRGNKMVQPVIIEKNTEPEINVTGEPTGMSIRPGRLKETKKFIETKK